MVRESNIDKYFFHFNEARIALSKCANMSYHNTVPFDKKTVETVGDFLKQLDAVFLRLREEAVEWMDEMDYVKMKGSNSTKRNGTGSS